MTAVTSSFDDGEDVATPGDVFDAEHHPVLETIRAIPNAATRRAVMAVFVVAVLKGRVGR
jgi:hypothetical protein